VCENTRSVTNCNQQLCIELSSVINFHRETEPANSLHYIFCFFFELCMKHSNESYILYNKGHYSLFSIVLQANIQVSSTYGMGNIYLYVYRGMPIPVAMWSKG
jgi:hypothetical protein